MQNVYSTQAAAAFHTSEKYLEVADSSVTRHQAPPPTSCLFESSIAHGSNRAPSASGASSALTVPQRGPFNIDAHPLRVCWEEAQSYFQRADALQSNAKLGDLSFSIVPYGNLFHVNIVSEKLGLWGSVIDRCSKIYKMRPCYPAEQRDAAKGYDVAYPARLDVMLLETIYRCRDFIDQIIQTNEKAGEREAMQMMSDIWSPIDDSTMNTLSQADLAIERAAKPINDLLSNTRVSKSCYWRLYRERHYFAFYNYPQIQKACEVMDLFYLPPQRADILAPYNAIADAKLKLSECKPPEALALLCELQCKPQWQESLEYRHFLVRSFRDLATKLDHTSEEIGKWRLQCWKSIFVNCLFFDDGLSQLDVRILSNAEGLRHRVEAARLEAKEGAKHARDGYRKCLIYYQKHYASDSTPMQIQAMNTASAFIDSALSGKDPILPQPMAVFIRANIIGPETWRDWSLQEEAKFFAACYPLPDTALCRSMTRRSTTWPAWDI